MKTTAVVISGFAAYVMAQSTSAAAPAAGGLNLPPGAGCGVNCLLRPMLYPRCQLAESVIDTLVAALAQKAGMDTSGKGGEEAPHGHGPMGSGSTPKPDAPKPQDIDMASMPMNMSPPAGAAPATSAAAAPAAPAAGHMDMGSMHMDVSASTASTTATEKTESMSMGSMQMDMHRRRRHTKRQGLDAVAGAISALSAEGGTGILNIVLEGLSKSANGSTSSVGLALNPEIKSCLCSGAAGKKLKVAAEQCIPKACAAYTSPLPFGGIYQGFVNYLCEGQAGYTPIAGGYPVGSIISAAGGLQNLPALLGSLGSMR